MCTPAPVDLFRISCQSTCVPGTTPSILHSCSRPLIRRILVTMHSRYHPRYRCQCVTPPSLSQFESPPLSHTLRAPRSHILWEPPHNCFHSIRLTCAHPAFLFFLFLFFFSHMRAPRPHALTVWEPPIPTFISRSRWRIWTRWPLVKHTLGNILLSQNKLDWLQ